MNYKPADFFIGVIDFFGILVPGAVLLFLDGNLLLKPLNLYFEPHSAQQWAAFFVGSYVFGHFLLGMGVPLNCTLGVFSPVRKDRLFHEARSMLSLPENIKQARREAFYQAYAFVRLNSAAALNVAV